MKRSAHVPRFGLLQLWRWSLRDLFLSQHLAANWRSRVHLELLLLVCFIFWIGCKKSSHNSYAVIHFYEGATRPITNVAVLLPAHRFDRTESNPVSLVGIDDQDFFRIPLAASNDEDRGRIDKGHNDYQNFRLHLNAECHIEPGIHLITAFYSRGNESGSPMTRKFSFKAGYVYELTDIISASEEGSVADMKKRWRFDLRPLGTVQRFATGYAATLHSMNVQSVAPHWEKLGQAQRTTTSSSALPDSNRLMLSKDPSSIGIETNL